MDLRRGVDIAVAAVGRMIDLGERGELFADPDALIAAIEDEAPRLHAPVVGHPAGDADQSLDLGIRGRRLLQLMDRNRVALEQEVDDG